MRASWGLSVLLLGVLLLGASALSKDEWNYIMSNGPVKEGAFRNAEPLTVHVIPHTHNDIGWTRTIGEYYVKQVRFILSSAVQALAANPARKFTYVETKFFQTWWNEQSNATRALVQKLVDNGQLEINMGGWSMQDEAGPEFEGMIQNMALGAQFIKETLHTRPRVAWHIDPFGHSSQNARLIADLGFDAFAINRIDYEIKEKLIANRSMEFIWKTSNSLGNETSIFVHVMSNHYCPPSEMDLGIWTQTQSSAFTEWPFPHTNPELESFPDTMQAYADRMMSMLRTRQTYYDNGNNVLIPFGCDFTFTNAELNFQQVDTVMEYVNSHQERYNAKIKYSHFSDYIKTLHSSGRQWRVYEGDFMPYPSYNHAFWTGYFTSRPRIKGEAREGHNLLRTVEALDAEDIINRGSSPKEYLDIRLKLRKSLAEIMHHDAITGTEKQHVADDYTSNLWKVAEENRKHADWIILHITKNTYNYSMNATEVLSKVKDSTTTVSLVLYNNLGWSRTEIITIPVPSPNLQLVDVETGEIFSELIPIPEYNQRRMNGTHFLSFMVTIPALGQATILAKYQKRDVLEPVSGAKVMDNQFFELTLDPKTGMLQTHLNKQTGVKTTLGNSLYHYQSSVRPQQASGAYIFKPKDGTGASLVSDTAASVAVYLGALVQEAHIQYRKGYSVVVRVSRVGDNAKFFEMLYDFYPIDEGRELITQFNTDLNSGDAFYGDANGLETLKRVRMDRAEPIAGNYYPQTSRLFIENADGSNRLTVITDRSHGFSSLKSGQVEVMLHRRCLQDDGYGVEEVLKENDMLQIHLWVMLANRSDSSAMSKPLSVLLNHPPHLFYGVVTNLPWRGLNAFSRLNATLPKNVHIASFSQPTTESTLILRLHHIFERGEHPELSKPVSVDLQYLIRDYAVKKVEEMSMSGMELQENVQRERIHWKMQGGGQTMPKAATLKGFTATLNPMDIGTYKLYFW